MFVNQAMVVWFPTAVQRSINDTLVVWLVAPTVSLCVMKRV
jgi:hypothetical protein